MKTIRCIFFGTPDFAVPALEALLQEKTIDIPLVITQPDKPQGRSNEPVPPPVKVLSERHGIPIIQPEILKNDTLFYTLQNYKPIDCNIVIAYGKLIPGWLRTFPEHGSLNVHPSLLPLLRGPSPIQTAILEQHSKTGITIMKLDDKMDHGPLVSQESVSIAPHTTYDVLHDTLARVAAPLLVQTVKNFTAGKLKPVPQEHAKATYTKLFRKKDGILAFNQPASMLDAKIRALNPWPGTYTFWNKQQLKIVEAEVVDMKVPVGKAIVHDKQLMIGTKKDALSLKKIQRAGKKLLTAEEFIRGNQHIINQTLPN